MDWGTSNQHGYLATSIPLRARIGWALISGLVLAASAIWFGGVGWMGALLTLAGFTAFFVTLAAVADLAAWRPVDGMTVAALSGAGAGAIWWSILRPSLSIWVPIATGVMLGLFVVWAY